jgi:hypothetical protein
MDGVLSFGEKPGVSETTGQLCRSSVRPSNEKSLLLLGLFAREYTRQPWARWRRERNWDRTFSA